MKATTHNTQFIPKLFLQNPWWGPPAAPDKVETALKSFEEVFTAKQRVYQNKLTKPNLTRLQNSALRALKNNDKLIVVEADKNMGVTVFARDKFIKQALDDDEHLMVMPQRIKTSLTTFKKQSMISAISSSRNS
jgi:hypothetical protein